MSKCDKRYFELISYYADDKIVRVFVTEALQGRDVVRMAHGYAHALGKSFDEPPFCDEGDFDPVQIAFDYLKNSGVEIEEVDVHKYPSHVAGYDDSAFISTRVLSKDYPGHQRLLPAQFRGGSDE